VLLLRVPYALKLRMPNSRGAAGIRLLCWLDGRHCDQSRDSEHDCNRSMAPAGIHRISDHRWQHPRLSFPSSTPTRRSASRRQASVRSAAHRVFQLLSILE